MTENSSVLACPHAAAGKYLTFNLAKEYYGIQVVMVKEIIRMGDITLVPQMPPYIRGVINLRGKIIPVIDLRIRLELQQANISERTCIMVVQAAFVSGNKTNIGLIVDSVEEVLNIPANQIEDPPEFAGQVSTEYIIGMAKAKDIVITLLDVDKVLSAESSC